MILAHLLIGMVLGLLGAGTILIGGGSVLAALFAYWLLGTLGLLGSAMFALAPQMAR
ncbi:MAG: hypothetical protein WBA25_02195 [Jannaschia sp.]